MIKKWMYLLFGACTLYGALELLGSLLTRLLLLYHSRSVFSVTEAASIGIIGGADGPTAVFVTTSPAGSLFLPVLLLAVGIGGILWLRRRK